jgi:uncharacterized protein
MAVIFRQEWLAELPVMDTLLFPVSRTRGNGMRSVWLFFLLAWVISWGGIVLSFGGSSLHIFQGQNVLSGTVSRQMLFIWLAMLAGPAIGGMLFTWMGEGRKGLKELFASSVRWKVKGKWYAAALFLFPVLLFMIFSALSFLLTDFSPASLVSLGIAAGLIGGYFEELGWTGFATPRMLQRFGFIKTGLVLGFLHATWHLFSDYLGSAGFYNSLYAVHFLLWILALVALRFIIIFIYHYTRSLLLAQLTHASFTGSQVIFTPAGLSGTETIVWYSAFTALMMALAVVIVVREWKTGSSRLQAAGRKLVLHNNEHS